MIRFFNPKKAESFDPKSQCGGEGGGGVPLGSRLQSAEKLCNLAHVYVKPCSETNFHTENQSGFQIMQNLC